MLGSWCNNDHGCSTQDSNELPIWFRKYSTFCITFPVIGTILLSVAVVSPNWEVIRFNDTHQVFNAETGGNLSEFNVSNIHLVGGIWRVCQIEKEMQNNIIACIVVVFLCILAIVVIGILSLKAMLIPATMVTSVLSLTSALFVIFANIIYHIKLHKLETLWGPCFPLRSIDESMYNVSNIISVETLYPLYISWASAVLYFMGFCFWNHLTRNMNAEFSASFV